MNHLYSLTISSSVASASSSTAFSSSCSFIGGRQNWSITATSWKGGWVTRPTVPVREEKKL